MVAKILIRDAKRKLEDAVGHYAYNGAQEAWFYLATIAVQALLAIAAAIHEEKKDGTDT